MSIRWTKQIPSGTSLLGYYTQSLWSFEETVARLITASGQEIESPDEYKCSFQFSGFFNGKVFTLYDYKEDRTIHIGGNDPLILLTIQEHITFALLAVEPSFYIAKEYYDQKIGHSYMGGEDNV